MCQCTFEILPTEVRFFTFLHSKLEEAFGSGCDLPIYSLNLRSARIIRPFYFCVGLSDLQKDEPEEGKPNTYALLVADTVIVTSDSDNSAEKEKERIATHHSAKSWTDIAYFFKVRHYTRTTFFISRLSAFAFTCGNLL